MKISIKKSYINRANLLFTGMGLIILGGIILYGKINFLNLVIYAISLVFIITGISQAITLIGRKSINIEDKVTIGNVIWSIILGVAVILFENISLSILPILFAGYTILNGLVKAIVYYTYLRNNVKGRVMVLFECVMYFLFGITLLFSPLLHLNTVLIIIGIYCILFGLNYIKDFIREIIPKRIKNKLKRKVRITLPVFLSALIPHKILSNINEYLASSDEVVKDIKEEEKEEEESDLEVFIHVTHEGIGIVGHVDLYYDGEVISYGNYDDSSFKLYGVVGRGILFITQRDKYINFCTNYSKKTIFGYGIKLNSTQKIQVEKKIKEIKSNLLKWDPAIVIDRMNNKEKNIEEYKDYASILYQATGATFYKFKSGKFKTYFGLNTNCVLLADSVIGRLGIDILNIGGMITPGTYYTYFQNEFMKRNSIVVSRNIYKM